MDLAVKKQRSPQPTRRSAAIDDYLKAIYALHQEHGHVTTSQVAVHMGVPPSSVTGMLQKLAQQGLVTYMPYHGVALSDRGQHQALEVLRHHRLLELFLVQELGYSWDEVHVEADVLEHVISETLEARIAIRLGHPTVDPHGDPIPSSDGTLPIGICRPLTDLALGGMGRITRVTDQQPEHLRYLVDMGLVLGVIVTVRAQAPFAGPLSLSVGDAVHHLDHRMAHAILVEDIPVQHSAQPTEKEA
jgi:DtxR family Mn-dependent transcriptional regulator